MASKNATGYVMTDMPIAEFIKNAGPLACSLSKVDNWHMEGSVSMCFKDKDLETDIIVLCCLSPVVRLSEEHLFLSSHIIFVSKATNTSRYNFQYTFLEVI